MPACSHAMKSETIWTVFQANLALVVDGAPSEALADEDNCIICLEATRERCPGRQRPEACDCACSFPCHAECYNAYVAQSPSMYKCPICRRSVHRLETIGDVAWCCTDLTRLYCEFWAYLVSASMCSAGFVLPAVLYWSRLVNSSDRVPVATFVFELFKTIFVTSCAMMLAAYAACSARAWYRGVRAHRMQHLLINHGEVMMRRV